MSLTNGRAIYNYLKTETTRHFPAVTFDALGESLLLGSNQWSRKLYLDCTSTTPFIRQFGDQIETINFVRIPQIPSSRAFGLAPVDGFDQYMQQAPADRSEWKVVPTTPNPFPAAMPLLFIIGGLAWLICKQMKRRAKN